jgi:hypothetical protein
MDDIPLPLLDGLSPPDAATVAVWWDGLETSARAELVLLYDARQDECFFGVTANVNPRRTPRVIGGKFIPQDDTSGWVEWRAEYTDFLLCHPELATEPPRPRTFYIGCTRHQESRVVLATGRIPADFQCPLRAEDCPIRSLSRLAPAGEPFCFDHGSVNQTIGANANSLEGE